MAKPKPRRKTGFPDAPPKPKSEPAGATLQQRPMRWDLVALFLVIAVGGSFLVGYFLQRPSDAPRYNFNVVAEYPHDPTAFTQGLVYEKGILWESTGRKGTSTLRKVELKSGKVLKQIKLDDDLFAEGLTLMNDQFYQLTYMAGKVFVYDREFKKIKEFDFEGQGWGLTHNGTDLIMSDGTPELEFRDPETFKVKRKIWVRDGKRSVGNLNELEFIGQKIYANQYQSDLIYEINPASGNVDGIIDLSGLWPWAKRPSEGILNGIALNTDSERMIVTGKYCPKVFEIELKRAEK